MKSVLFISRTSGDRPGGMQTHTNTLLAGLRAERDLTVEACCFSGPKILLPFFFFRAFLAACTTHADTVLLADAVLSPLLFALLPFRARLRRTVIVHGLDLTWKMPGYRFIVVRALHMAHKVAAVSSFTAAMLEKLGIPADRIVIIPCPVPPSHGADRVRLQNQILLLGRLVKRKGTAWFLQFVLPLLWSRHPDLHVVVAGDGPELRTVQRSAAGLGSPEQLWIIGRVSEEQKETLLHESTLLVVPNLHRQDDPEGFGIVCLEAAVRGLPVVAARIDGLTDAVIDGVSGTFFQSGSPEDCVRAIEAALARTWDRDAMKQEIQNRFGIGRITASFLHDVL